VIRSPDQVLPVGVERVRKSASGGIVFRHAEAVPQRVEHVDEQGPEPGRVPRLILTLIV